MDCCALCKEYRLKENVIADYDHCFLMFNRFPYLPGHVMLVPKRTVKTLFDMTALERMEIMETLSSVQKKVLRSLKDLGVTSTNIGINTGENSGASIPQHLHIHVVPRRSNDMNFMHTTTAQPFQHRETYTIYREKIEEEFKQETFIYPKRLSMKSSSSSPMNLHCI